ncbi:PQQ-binding-like beta-propeller repeat protein [Halorussus sp. MSC15.2]|uniref:outer membrane protein assembly factor BamB family protein n=1 Tax=Halorussus sp. MSC15.2 TaxID=2283638 RepID=UPI0013D15EE4|nr:PQQ-binding-like beta-propeller repeat protein [Halorussus sp. MSC15.2]NEU58492.1 PQQ-binding-like beta-propeller repeat protein [Halorussus sp. MSC15.2]
MNWSPSRREFLTVAGPGGVAPSVVTDRRASLGNVSLGNATDAVPDHPFAPTPEVEWSVDTETEEPLLRGSAADDAVYLTTETGVRGFSTDGRERWRRRIARDGADHPVEIHPGTGVVYAEGRAGIQALDAEDGHTRWRYAGESGVAERYVDVSLVTPETVFVHEDGIAAVAASDGHERWRFRPDDSLWFNPHLDGDTLYAGTTHGHLYALSATDGSVRWHADRSADGTPRFSVAGVTDDVVLAWGYETGRLYGFDCDDGALRWRFDADADERGFPGVVLEDTAYLGDGRRLRAISTAGGTERWRYDAGGPVVGWPRIDDRTAYFGTRGGVHAVSTADGTGRWRFSTDADARASVVGVTDGTVVVDSEAEAVYGLDAKRGRLRWRFDHPGRSRWLPQVTDDGVYFVTGSGTIYALSSPDSTPLYDAYRTATSPVALAVGGLVGAAVLARAYRRRDPDYDARGDSATPTEIADFELGDRLAGSDSAEVFEARNPAGDRVALTRVTPDAIADDAFEAAVEKWADLDVRGVLAVRTWGTEPSPWVATDPADASLADRAEDLPTADLAHALADAAETVHRAHRAGVTHGALGPGTLWLSDGEVRVSGWRLAAARRAESPVRPTEPNDDPETADGDRLAVLAAGLLGGSATDPDRPDELDAVLSRALAADSADGYDSPLRFADALRWAVRETGMPRKGVGE